MSKDNINLQARDFAREEVEPFHLNGLLVLVVNSLLMIGAVALLVIGVRHWDYGSIGSRINVIVSLVYLCLIGPFMYSGLRLLRPNEAMVFTFFGRYHGTLKKEGLYFVNTFAITMGSKISLKVITHNNETQKINDLLGNPIVAGIVVVWRVVNPTKAVFNIGDFRSFISCNADMALRNIVRLYPYDTFGEDEEKTLRSSSQEISHKLKEEIQDKVEIAGLEIMDARIHHLSYAPEIASAMLQRQQARASVDAKQLIVEVAVDMVEMAIDKLKKNNIVDLDEERKAAMVSNLMVVLCGSKDATPVINSGSLY